MIQQQTAHRTHNLSDDAKALMHYVGSAEVGCADDSDRAYCLDRAREWASHIIAKATKEQA